MVTANVRFDHLAERAVNLWGEDRICRVLRIGRFADLMPTPAHRYLAWLAREGLVGEVITTNWDCCVERAYSASFDRDGDRFTKPVRTQDEYCEWGGMRQSAQGVPFLRVYKINGCARDYGRSGRAKDILLTNIQLRAFRERRQWVSAHLSERLHCHALLFCGFGSEEPQVQQTVITVIEKFGRKLLPEAVAGLPNALFIAAHTQASSTQTQLLSTFLGAHSTARRAAALHYYDNLFSGADARGLGGPAPVLGGPGPQLDADLFLERLFQAAYGRLLRRYSEPGSAFHCWLADCTTHPAIWREHLLDALYPQKSSDPLDPLFGRHRGLVAMSRGGRAPVLWRWLWSVMHPHAGANAVGHWYPALHEDALSILAVLLLLVCLTVLGPAHAPRAPRWLRAARRQAGMGLCLRLGASEDRLPIVVVQEGTDPPDRGARLPGRSRLVLRFEVPSLKSFRQLTHLHSVRPATSGEPSPLRVVVCIPLDATDLVRLAGTPERMASSVRRLAREYKSPPRRTHLEPLR